MYYWNSEPGDVQCNARAGYYKNNYVYSSVCNLPTLIGSSPVRGDSVTLLYIYYLNVYNCDMSRHLENMNNWLP